MDEPRARMDGATVGRWPRRDKAGPGQPGREWRHEELQRPDQKQVGGPGLALAVDADTVTGVPYRLRVRNHCDSSINNMTTIEDQDSLSEHRCACDACTVLHNSCYVQYNSDPST